MTFYGCNPMVHSFLSQIKNRMPSGSHWGPARAYPGFYIAQFLFLGVYLPFFPGWLDAEGFDAASIGWLTGGALILRLLFAPVLAYRAESLADPRLSVRLTTAAMFALLLLLWLPVPNFLIAIAGIMIWFLFGLLVPITDTAVLRADARGELRYGRARGLGSFSFVVASLGGGAVIAALGDQAIVVWCALAAGLTFWAAMALPREPKDETWAIKPRPTIAGAMTLFRSRSFLLMLFAGGLAQGAHGTYYAFSELHWSQLGYSSFTIGILWALGVVCEIVLLYYAREVTKHISAPVLIGFGALAAFIRWPLVGLSPPIFVLIFLQALHALTFAATYLGTVEFIQRAVPEAYRTTAMTLMSALGVGAITGVATVVAGGIFDKQAPFAAYGLMGAMGGVGVILAVLLYRRWDGGMLRAVPDTIPEENVEKPAA